VGRAQVELGIMVASVAGHGMCGLEGCSRWESERSTAFRTAGVEGLQREALSPLSDSEVEPEAQGAGHPGGVGRDDAYHRGQECSTQEEGEGSRATPGRAPGHRVDRGLARRETE